MASSKKNDYFAMMKDLTLFSCKAANMLEHILTNFKIEELNENLHALHAIEHEADIYRHTVIEKLVREFITPIDREDIMTLINSIDDVTDAVEDVLLKIYMYNIQSIGEDALSFVKIIKKCCDALVVIFNEFSNFKKSKTLHNSIIELNALEEQGDSLYIDAVHKLYASQAEAKVVAGWTEIYRCMEKSCDTCENIADIVEHVIMKNS